jgi:hypothetical protein
MQNDDSLNQLYEELRKGGWVMAILGALGMLARLILTNEKYSLFIWTRKIIAGGIIGVISYLALLNFDIDPIYKSVLVSIAGSMSPELFDFVRRKFITKLNDND